MKKYYENHDAPFKGRTHTPETIKKIFEYRKINKLEQKVADWLDENGIGYHFQFFITENDVCKSYDFQLKGTDIILEVHGDYWHGGSKYDSHFFNVDEVKQNDKLKKQIAENRGYNVVVVWEHEIDNDINILHEKIKVKN